MSNTIVQEIHSAFTGAEEQLLQEARQILREGEDERKKETAGKLARLGFSKSKPVTRLSKDEQEKADQLLFLKKRYDRIAPQYKFITEQKLLEICIKYGLVVGSSERYTQDIPEENQEDLMNFKVLDDSFLELNSNTYRETTHKTKDGKEMHPKDMGTRHIDNLLNLLRRKIDRNQHGAYVSQRSVESLPVDLIRVMVTELTLRGEHDTIKTHKVAWGKTAFNENQVEKLFTPMKTTYFYVAADIDSFDTAGVTLESNQLIEQDGNKELEESMKSTLFREYDPIVLAKVQGGYLIVTAWGEEASDPDVINPGRN